MSSVPPTTASVCKLVFNEPLAKKPSLFVRIQNSSSARIAWAVRTSSLQRLAVSPVCGVLDAGEAVKLSVSCKGVGLNENVADKISVEWVNTPPATKKEFNHEWLQGEALVHRKNFPVEYDL